MLMTWWKAMRAEDTKNETKPEATITEDQKEKMEEMSDDEKELKDVENQIKTLEVNILFVMFLFILGHHFWISTEFLM